MRETTIGLAAMEAIRIAGGAITAQEVYDIILKNRLYEFKAKDPLAILKSTLRKHTEGINLKRKTEKVYFRIDGNFKYSNLK